jgi:O-antigen/teichoic acid export membrane protein
MSLGQSIRGGVKWLMIGNIGMRFMEFAFGVILARLLVPADFGMIVTISVFTGFVSMLSSAGMGQSLIRAKEADENDFTAVFTFQLALGVLIYLGFFISAPWVADFFADPLYGELLRVTALSFLMRPFAFMRTAWLNRGMEFKQRSLIELLTVAIGSLSSVLMAWAGMGVWSLALSGLVSSLVRNILLARITPLRLRLNPDWNVMRKHGGYGFKITANDFLSYLTRESKNLILSKLAGASFLGLFNKAESLSRLPNQMFMSATAQPVFRAMSKIQDDIKQTREMFFRVITLLMVYTTPFYIGIWWVAEPFIDFVYGEKWLPAIEPLRILVLSGAFLNIVHPCAVLLDAQNKLNQEMAALVIRLIVTLAACLIGLEWGLAGVSWALFLTHLFSAVYYYLLAQKAVDARLGELVASITPGLILNSILFLALAATDFVLGELQSIHQLTYLVLMSLSGALVYLAAFLYIPIPALGSEAERWRQKINNGLEMVLNKKG